jgi:hypothetical protein
MPDDIVKDIANLYQRVGTMETEQTQIASISRIVKSYEYLGIRVKVTTKIHQYKVCSQTLKCGTGVII